MRCISIVDTATMSECEGGEAAAAAGTQPTHKAEMLRALYDFKATFAKTLSFREKEVFLLHPSTSKQRNWWQVVNSRGHVGYVPSNYVTVIQVSMHSLFDFLERCVSALCDERNRCMDSFPLDRQELLQRLVDRKQQAKVAIKFEAGVAHGAGSDAGDRPRLEEMSPCRRRAPADDIGSTVPASVCSSDNSRASPKLALSLSDSSEVAYQLVDQVRRHTQLSHELSRIAVTVVISNLRDILPPSASADLSAIVAHVQGPLVAPRPVIEETHDAQRLQVIFTELTSCKDDSQQRSWMLYEDEATITEYIKELTSILSNADSAISRHVMAKEQYAGVAAVVQYYQMEVRWSIRQLLLQAFGVMCSLDAAVVTLMLNSILPMELARDMCSNPRNIPRLNYSSLLLTMIFSMGEPMPVTHLEYLGMEFVTFILELLESPPDTDVEEQIPDLFVNLVLAYNLQFAQPNDNIILVALIEKAVAKTFTEKILLLLNREEDPVRVFEHQPPPPHSVLKLFVDLFSNPRTAVLFYTNDTKVLIDIIVRQLADLSPGDQRRQQYLELCRLVMRNTSYAEHRHRQDEILRCFTRIFCEETELSADDQRLVREISNEFPQYFKT